METATKISANFINLTQFRLEEHVQKAFRKAWVLSEGKPVNACHMLKSVIIISKQVSSPAFNKFVSLSSLTTITETPSVKAPPADLAAMPFTEPISEALNITEKIIKKDKAFWGRDYITTALLAINDPSLNEFARDAGISIKTLQDKWFEYVTSSQQRRSLDLWQRWWQSAGVPLPGVVQTKLEDIPAYLLTWNPNKFPWKNLEETIQRIEDQGYADGQWSTGNRKDIIIGARVYLLRQGDEPRGLVGTGLITSEVFEDADWDQEKMNNISKKLYAKITWQALSREPIVYQNELPDKPDKINFWTPQGGGQEIDADFAKIIATVWDTAWKRYRSGLPNLAPHQWIARFNADTGSKNDQLQIERYVNSFARVIASRNLKPPLSIGLFGDWGSGKTFFMELLHDKIEAYSKEDFNINAPLYWKNICQIKFNAWHYAETNLWASLVSTIFNELRLYLDGDEKESDAFNQLLIKLEVAGELRKEAQEKLDAAVKEHDKAKKKLLTAEKELSGLPAMPELSDKKLREILEQSVKEGFTGGTISLPDLLRSAGESLNRNDLNTAADQIDKGITTIKEFRLMLDDVESLSTRTSFWWRILSTAKLYKSKKFWVIVSILTAIPAIGIFLQQKFFSSEMWPHVWSVIFELITAFSAVITWMHTKIKKAGGVFDQLNSVQKSIERQIEDAQNADRLKYETERDKAIRNEKNALENLEKARLEQLQAANAVEEATRALKESTSQERFSHFIRERAASADYHKHLGLIAMVHRDFQRLSELMINMQTSNVVSDIKRIERIVLYVDDLDRCRPEKVVQVLEAIHLLLFFPLFVVVVGVDSRWVSRALFKHYEDMLIDETVLVNDQNKEFDRAPADSQNYLEKIFQVPFWLRKMDSSAVTRLIRSLISDEEIEHTQEIESKAKPKEISDPKVGEQKKFENKPEPLPQTKIVTVEAEGHLEDSGEQLAPPTEGLTITDIELEYMNDIAPLMPRTPRSIKRFVNIYRLYKAGLSTPALARFLGTPEKPGNFRAVQILLALVTGEPRLAQAIFRELLHEENANKQLSSLVETLEKGDDSWKITLDALQGFAKGNNDIMLSELQQVSALVGRYSVHHMVSQSPGESGLS